MIWLAYNCASTRKIKAELEAWGVQCQFGNPGSLSGNILVIGWGRGTNFNRGVSVLNSRFVGSKLRELQLLQRVGVPCVEFAVAKPSQGVWYARTLYHHQGKDLLAELSTGDFYTRKVKCSYEYRAHVFKDQVFALAVKWPKAGAHPWVKNHANGWGFRLVRQDNPKLYQLQQESIKAVSAVNYDFGAVDVGVLEDWGPDGDGGPIVFEVNSAPTLIQDTARCYATQFYTYYKETIVNGR